MGEGFDSDALRICDALVQSYIQRGEYESAIKELARGYQRYMVGFCRKLLWNLGPSDLAEDVAQEIFMAAYTSMPKFRMEATVRTWLFAIARNKCRERRRTFGRQEGTQQEQHEAIRNSAHRQELSPEEQHKEERLQRLCWCMSQLNKRDFELLTRHYIEQLNYTTLARYYYCSEKKIGDRLKTARTRLLQIYRKYYGKCEDI
jgi:RNA polymerase sigma-70 factor, ECF subfamily